MAKIEIAAIDIDIDRQSKSDRRASSIVTVKRFQLEPAAGFLARPS